MHNAATITPCPYSGQWDGYQSLSTFLQKTARSHLQLHATACYRFPALHKTSAGRGNPKFFKATPDAESVFFVVCHTSHSMAWYVFRQCSYNRRSVALLAYHAAHNGVMCSYRCAGSYPLAPMSTPRRPRMVTLAGLPKGRPVSLKAGISTPVNVTALFERGNSGGDSLNNFKEAA
ncbi:TPA: ash family protein [Salmonella enterica subsp. diarizonae serovar 61:r:-]